MTHHIFVNKTSAELIEAYNSNHNSWTVPAPQLAKEGDGVLMTSKDGVNFLCWVAGVHEIIAPGQAQEMTIRISG
jgi:hypothetical protein